MEALSMKVFIVCFCNATPLQKHTINTFIDSASIQIDHTPLQKHTINTFIDSASIQIDHTP
jgi:hypothetical protein